MMTDGKLRLALAFRNLPFYNLATLHQTDGKITGGSRSATKTPTRQCLTCTDPGSRSSAVRHITPSPSTLPTGRCVSPALAFRPHVSIEGNLIDQKSPSSPWTGQRCWNVVTRLKPPPQIKMSIQKIAPSALAFNQEANFGLATVNVDFSLVKVEAPAEFRVLGKELSQERRKSAEIGISHVTARKLGALFRHSLPKTPHLIRRYGLRASEIASNPHVNPKPATGIHGIFTDHVGIDGTNIWAAATSGSDAVAMHLLACMLARIWSHPEAVAIWAEMVAYRKRELGMTDETDPHHQHMLQDSTIEVARDQLAHWDSSARAWLSAADEAMELKQTQLMLILNNISLPVNTKPELYHNVLESWTSAMVAADNLLQGMPQSVQSGSVLLGLSSWHLYPNLLILKHSRDLLLQNDHLVDTAGILTLGLNNERNATCGVSWSLPLGQLKYYGRPVVTESSLVTKGNRLTPMQLFRTSLLTFSFFF